MLWYKAWIETRARFLAALCGITFLMDFMLHHYQSVKNPSVLYNNLYISRLNSFLIRMWLLSIILFAMGGLMRERAVGCSSFTLALPVSRLRLLGARVAVGLAQSGLAALLPWVAILAITDRAGKPFPASQAGLYALLLVSGGLVYFSSAILISTLIEGEYTAPAAAYGFMILSSILLGNSGWTDPYLNIGKFMSGGFLFNNRTYLLTPKIPWPGLIACWSAAVLILIVSMVVTDRREF